MTAPRSQPDIAQDWSCAADFLDDIEVDSNGMCRWSDVANAQTHIRHSLRSVMPPRSGVQTVDTIISAARECVGGYPVASGIIHTPEGDGYGWLRALRLALEAHDAVSVASSADRGGK